MLPTKAFEKTNFSDGMIFNPEQIKVNDEYYATKISLLSRYGVGKGILVGFEKNMKLKVEDGSLYIYPGAAINEKGDFIYVPKKTLVLKDIQCGQFADKQSIHVYLKYDENLEDFKASRKDEDVKLYYKMTEKYTIEIRSKALESSDLFEVARVYVDHSASTNIANPINPYIPVENEVDLRFASKLEPLNSSIKPADSIMIENILRKYADFLTEMSFNKSIFTASIAASFANKVFAEVKTGYLTTPNLYALLAHLLHVSSKIKEEKSEIVNTGFWKNILRLQNLFSFAEKFEADYYDMLLNLDNSFFSKVFLHFGNASILVGSWDDMMQSSESNVRKKEYYTAGSCPDCDLHIEGDDIEEEHARIYAFKDGFFIQDISNSSGIYINAQRLESGVKKFIRNQDFVTLGKNGKVVNLNNL